MATRNPFNLLDDDDNGDLSALFPSLVASKDKPVALVAAKKQQPAMATSTKLPTQPLPSAQAGKYSQFPSSLLFCIEVEYFCCLRRKYQS